MAVAALWLFKRLWPDATGNILAFTAGTGNTGYFGIALALIVFEPRVADIYIFTVLASFFYESTTGFYITAKGTFTARESLAKVLRLPVLSSVRPQGPWWEQRQGQSLVRRWERMRPAGRRYLPDPPGFHSLHHAQGNGNVLAHDLHALKHLLEDAESLVWCGNVICIPHPAFWRCLQAAVRQLLHEIGIPIAPQPETDERDAECAGIVCFAE